MPNDLFTTSYLGSYAGLMAVTYLLVQFFKEPVKKYFNDWVVRLLAVFFALVIQLFMLFVMGDFTIEAIGLGVLNSFLIATAAAGTYDISKSIDPSTIVPTNITYNDPLAKTLPINDIGTTTPAATKIFDPSQK
jgi:hypothetical protein